MAYKIIVCDVMYSIPMEYAQWLEMVQIISGRSVFNLVYLTSGGEAEMSFWKLYPPQNYTGSTTLFLLNLTANSVTVFFRDNNKPINILTGIDYWLDNLMCNVPELVMCFHVNGIVQVNYSYYHVVIAIVHLQS